MEINKLKACVVGSGFIGPVHAEALRRIGVDVVAVVTRDEALAKKFQCDTNAKYFFTDIKKALECSEIDTVHLCTPNNLHYEHTKLAIEHGKHVICEKPLAMDSSESSELLELSKKTDKVTAVSYNLRYYPLVHQTRDMIKNTNDKIIAIHGGFLQDWLLYKEDYSWRVDEKLGGKLRVVSDIGTHWIDMVTFATGLKVKSVFADLLIYHTTRKKPKGNVVTFNKENEKQDYEEIKITTEDFATVLIKFENGSRGVCTVSQVSAGRKCKLHYEIDTENNSYSFTSDEPNSLLIGKRNEANQILIKDPSLMDKQSREITSYPGGHTEGYPDTYKQFFKSVYSYIARGDYKAKRDFPTFEDGHNEMLICDAIIKSSKENRWVNIDELKN